MAESSESRGGIQSVDRAARILRAFADPGQQLTITEVATMLDVHKSTASRLVATLVGHGLLEGGGDAGPVRLGPELRRLGRLSAGGADLAEIARGPMEKLAVLTGETVTLAVRDGESAVTIAQSGGTHRIGVQSWVGARTPLPLTADGVVLLAYADRVPESLSRAKLAQVARVRDLGWTSSQGELEENLHGVAVPLLDEDGTCLAALCVSGPSYRLTTARFEELADHGRRAAYAIADDRLGHWRQNS